MLSALFFKDLYVVLIIMAIERRWVVGRVTDCARFILEKKILSPQSANHGPRFQEKLDPELERETVPCFLAFVSAMENTYRARLSLSDGY